MEIIKITKRIYKVLDANNKTFLKFEQFRKSRESIGLSVQRRCFSCNHKFKDDEDTYLVMLSGTHNQLFCKECNDKALDDLKNDPPNKNICGNCDAFCECGLGNNSAKHDDPACEYFDDTTLKQLGK